MTSNKTGLSKKTNVAMTAAGCFGLVGTATNDWRVELIAIIAACVVALVAITFQARIDQKELEQ